MSACKCPAKRFGMAMIRDRIGPQLSGAARSERRPHDTGEVAPMQHAPYGTGPHSRKDGAL